ncbi:uncharacterized protein LOC124608348 [Schistocerca americana]|uniref:uncharacterized protein LOC124608348 n=1 Tax=Schistocerca americana TaxID=7009 RepID=UPI001F4FAA03|nr:uncharacterized protein LOC124608348 [Schistocerca americana]XP_047096800.1 uncharacterized protein LOC124709511 [Schistocerca piceifrons]XP_049803786.1 uncharacterized protein LOC126239032 [Schistocerca nitens]XP_049803787.1 uncharacterized protein LOC126239032 [Schistocerca nitens]XP_049949033.1 uncharacterized protein LOC126457073 [Schistocerca serialis cubense]
MHFWIDKRSQTCGYNGRRSLPMGCGTRRPRCKPMVTPVHRFTPIDCGRRSQLSVPPTFGSSSGSHRQPGPHAVEVDSSVFLDLPLEPATEATVHSIAQQQLLPVGRVRCGMWASFALATVFVAGAKFYFDHEGVHGTGLEVLVFCSLLVVFLLAGCTVSLCRSRVTRELLSAAVASSAVHVQSAQAVATSSSATPVHQTRERPVETTSVTVQQEVAERQVVALPSSNTVQVPEPPPPPYHVAVLLPVQQRPHPPGDESPPPSYEKAVS